MPQVTVQLPSILGRIIDESRAIPIEADSLGGALRALVDRHPALGVHLFDETGNLRQHVLCFHTQTNTRWLDSIEAPLAKGDTITILQAVSGG